MTLIMLFVSTDENNDNCLFLFSFFPSSLYSTMCYIDLYEWSKLAFCSNVRSLNDRGVPLPSLPLLIQAYFRQGVALQYLGRHADALAAFASGLAQDPKSLQLLVGMVEAAMKSPLRGELEPSDQTPGRCHLHFVLLPNICRHSSRSRFTRRRSSWKKLGKFQWGNKLNKSNKSRK